MTGEPTVRTFLIPYGLNLRFLGRDNELRILKEALKPGPRLRAVGIHGLGGSGKTQLALQYANTSLEVYQVIAWIPADTQTSFIHAVSNLAKKLELVDGASEDDCDNVPKVRDWLNTAGKSFLLVFDDVDKIELLDQIWPASAQGSIIITSRSPSVASGRTTITLALGSFSTETSIEVLRSLSRLEFADDKEKAAAQKICRLTAGLPLAVTQISNLIRNRGLSYVEAGKMLRESAEKVYAKAGPPAEYDHTVLTVWDTSLQRLSSEATALLNLLVFLDPDKIPERFITNKQVMLHDTPLGFVLDSFAFSDAVVELTQTSLITRDAASKQLSMHFVVRAVVRDRLSERDQLANFDLAVRILSSSFPNTWKGGHGWASWDACKLALPHIRRLKARFEKQKLRSSIPDLWAELLFRAGTYLWEKEEALVAKSFIESGLGVSDNLPAAVMAQAKQVLGDALIDIARPRAALASYEEALALREGFEGPDSPAVADVHNSIACAYTELDDADQAFTYLKKATAIHKTHDPSKMSRTLAIRAMTCLRAGVADDALAALRECWRLQGMTQEQIEASKYPKHSGDILLLARILSLQGKKYDALSLIERVPNMRAVAYGEDGKIRYRDTFFILAQIHDEGGDPRKAASVLKHAIDECEKTPELRAQLARNLWFYASMASKVGANIVAGEMRTKARTARSGIAEREWPDEDTDEGFLRLMPWMLW